MLGVLIVVRSATDNRLLLLILWLTGISMSLILLLRHHKVGAFRRLDGDGVRLRASPHVLGN